MSLPLDIGVFVRRFSSHVGLSAWLARREPAMRIIMLHGVGGERYPPEVFELQVRLLQKELDLVPLERIVEKTVRRANPAHEVALTFDDGLRNHVSVVYPILKRLGAPATFFVCPGLIQEHRWIWNVEVRERLRTLGPRDLAALGASLGAPAPQVEAIVDWMKGLPFGQRRLVEDRVHALTRDHTFAPALHEANDPMSWDELLSLDPAQITIGSHTMTHPILTSLDFDRIEAEIRESQSVLEARLGRPVRYFCYPNGANDARTVSAVRARYTAAVSVEEGFVRPDVDLHLLPRVPTGPSLEALEWRLHRPTG